MLERVQPPRRRRFDAFGEKRTVGRLVEALGEALRDIRTRNGMTLRELSDIAAISPGYLSELERGRKEVSSELLASVCQGLSVSVSDVIIDAAGTMALHTARPEMAAM